MAGEWYRDTHAYRFLSKYLANDEPNASGYIDAFCPLHADTKRSAGFNFEKDQWSCRAGCGSGSVDELVRQLEREAEADFVTEEAVTGGFVDEAEVISLEAKRAQKAGGGGSKTAGKPPPTEEEIAAWVVALQDNKEVLDKFISKRGIPADVLEDQEIGWSEENGAYTMPIRDTDGNLLNLRLYNPDRLKTKIWSWGGTGMDPNAIYPEKTLKENTLIILAEGEWDALIATWMGFPSVTGTTGAMQWMPKWNRKFEGKDVVIVYDRDKTGDVASVKVARNLDGVARSVRIAELPLSWSEKHGQDITDFFHTHGNSAEDFKAVLRDARLYAAPKDGEAVQVSVGESYNPSLSGSPMSMTVSVVGKGLQTHLVPKEAVLSCAMNAGPKCHGCPMADVNGMMEVDIKPTDEVVLSLRDVATTKRDEVIREYVGAHKCGKMDTDIRSYTTTELLVVRPSIEEDDGEDDHRSRTIINVGEYRTETNRVVRITGTAYPSPTAQESVFQAWQIDPVESSLDRYELTKAEVELMKLFRPEGKQTPLKKMGRIARDLSFNVTRIYDRLELHIAMDLVWHSVLTFSFAGQVLERGLLELLVVGDSRTGKSEVATKLSKHYGFGRVISCESASIPGLLGAVKPMPGASKSWTLEWGAIPLNDRRLLALDEAGGLSIDQIGQLSSVRSTGIAEIVKAEREQTRARTRLVWLANPRDNRHGMASYMYGIRAIGPLIGNQEDIARFDLAMALDTRDVPMENINRRQESKKDHRHTAEACHALLRWTWSRQRDQIEWEAEAEDEVYAEAMRLGKEYVPDPPLIQGQNVRVKIAKMAVAVAARTFSTDKSHEKVLVQKRHVTSAVEFIDHLYGMDAFGYKEVSARQRKEEKEAIASMDDVKEYLYSRVGLSRFLIGTGGQFRRQQMEEQLNYSREEANVVIQRLSQLGMIKSLDAWDYKIMPHLNTILRETKE